jgi:hypothetical protein
MGSTAPAGAVSGDIDPAFGSGGRAAVTFPGEVSPRDLRALPDGRIVVGGTLVDEASGRFALALARLDAGGVVDAAVGQDGKALTGFPNGGAQLSKIHLLGDGSLLTGGTFFRDDGTVEALLGRYGPDGRIDASFGQAGFLSVPGFSSTSSSTTSPSWS